MTTSIKFGTITRVIRSKRPAYIVQLDGEKTVYVTHEQVTPRRSGMLNQGSRLSIQFDNVKVIGASTDLKSPKSTPAKNFSPQGDEGIKPGLYHVIITNLDRDQSIVTVTIRHGGPKIRIRLPHNNPEWKNVYWGRKFDLEVSIDSEGHTKYVLGPESSLKGNADAYSTVASPTTNADVPTQERVTPTKKPAGEVEHLEAAEVIEKLPGPGAEEVEEAKAERVGLVIQEGLGSQEETQRQDFGSAQQAEGEHKFEAEGIGIDPQYFQEREKEGHRFEIIAFLHEHLHDDLIEWYRMRPAQEARFGIPKKPLNPTVENIIKETDSSFKEFYIHQARALDSIRAGRNLVIVTQTASGKTMCYNPAIFEHFSMGDPSAHALYIFPLNALMIDQIEKIELLSQGLHQKNYSINFDYLKGGRGIETRLEIARENPHILAINPEMLSVFLGEPEKWRKFLSNLQFIVVDEVHSYRGILGMHMAGILRRLLLAAHRYHSNPQFILSSATVSNPLDLAVRLTSLPEETFDILREEDDGSRQNYKHWISLNPDAHDIGNGHDNYLATAASVMVDLLCSQDQNHHSSPLNTILFAKSIRDVNKAFTIVQENLRIHRPDLVMSVRKFVSAELGPDEKNEIYHKLKSGELIGVVSTNALEAGIDIGKLDACIIAGFPFSVMRMRQMAGRVGRQQEGLVVFVPHPLNPLDQYYRNNPMLLLTQPPEVFVVDPENPYIARKHINAAAYELKGINRRELSFFGAAASETIKEAIKDRVITEYGDRYFGQNRGYRNPSDQYAIVGMRSQNQVPYLLCKNNGSTCQRSEACFNQEKKNGCDDRIAVLDQQYAYRDCHPGAIYESVDGALYRITSFDDRNRFIRANVVSETVLDRTFVEEYTTIKILDEFNTLRYFADGIELREGKVRVTRSFNGYYTYSLIPQRKCRRCKKIYDQNVTQCQSCGKTTSLFFEQSKLKRLDFPEPYDITGLTITLDTVACWLKVAAEYENNIAGASFCKLPGMKNRVLEFLRRPLGIDSLILKLNLTSDEVQIIESYHREASAEVRNYRGNGNETLLFPGVYEQCLIGSLRAKLTESRALEVFQALTGYPVTNDLNHVCRDCQTSDLLPALHTLEHTVWLRYPSVALGDFADIAAHTVLGHPDTGAPTIFWYDNYQGGLGAAEKLFEQFHDLLVASEKTLSSCTCTTIEGCPQCTQISSCDRKNEALNKPAAQSLISLLRGTPNPVSYRPFIYSGKKKADFDKTYNEKEYAHYDYGRGEESPSRPEEARVNPFMLLRIQPKFHVSVLQKAYEIRSLEISNEIPPVSAVQLNQAYKQAAESPKLGEWNISPDMTPYEILEIQTLASQHMVRNIYRVIAQQVHPDTYRGDKEKANEMMKLVNGAYERVLKDKA